MRGFAFLLAAAAVCAAAQGARADDKIRLAQSGTVTACMMLCNSQAASCQTTCLIPTPPVPGTTSTTVTTNATASTTCVLNCSSVQLSCQTTCARQSPSQ
jgi:hypothetical protein